MTERQRLITKYTTRLSRATSARYQLHFLRTERDESARHMLIESLKTIQKETGNQEFLEVINEVSRNSGASIIFGKHVEKKNNQNGKSILGHEDRPSGNDYGSSSGGEMSSGKGKKADYASRGNTNFQALRLEDSLKEFNMAIKEYRITSSHADKFYKQRTEINLCQGNYKEALALATKSGYSEMAFVAAIAAGEFEIAKEFFGPIIRNIVTNNQERDIVATTFEMIHLVLFVCFATSTSNETSEIAAQLYNSTNFELQILREISDAFTQRNFGLFVKIIPKMTEILKLSIYTAPIVDNFIEAMKSNCIVNKVSPLANARIDALKSEFGIPEKEIVDMIRKNIRSHKLDGKLDLVKMAYIGDAGDKEQLEISQYFARALKVRQEFELNLWQSEYNSIKRPEEVKKPLSAKTAKQ